MKKARRKPGSIDEYIGASPESVRGVLEQVRATIRKAAPEATETISYGIPTYFLNGNLVHFAGFGKHVGFYPTPSAISAFQKQLRPYQGARGSVQFPLDAPMPLGLIEEIVRFRVGEVRGNP